MQETLSSSGIQDVEKAVHEAVQPLLSPASFFLCCFTQSRKNIERGIFKICSSPVQKLDGGVLLPVLTMSPSDPLRVPVPHCPSFLSPLSPLVAFA